MIIGVTGAVKIPSGQYVGMKATGKDAVADVLVKSDGFVKVALADPLKRIAQDVFAFSREQLWGPSEKRDEPDKRYPTGRIDTSSTQWLCTKCAQVMYGEKFEEKSKGHIGDGECFVCEELHSSGDLHCVFPPEFLTPRFALQQLGTEWGRNCYPNVWVDYMIRVHNSLKAGSVYYDQQSGLRGYTSLDGVMMRAKTDVIVPDVRFKNEIDAIKKANGKVIRVVRPGTKPETVDMHPSEQEALSIRDYEFDFVIDNSGDLYLLELRAKEALSFFSGRILPYDNEQKDVPPFKRNKS